MEIHPPDHPILSPRDFFVHLFTITVGLLIALSLEGAVEAMHHRHLVHVARENIRIELQANHTAAQHDLDLVQKNVEQQKRNIAAIHGLQDEKNFHGSVRNSMEFESLSDAAWRTARDTGALGFMPYAEVQQLSDVYLMQDLVNSSSTEAAKLDFDAAAAFDMGIGPDKLPSTEYTRLLHDNADVQIRFETLKQFVQQYDDQCSTVLKTFS